MAKERLFQLKETKGTFNGRGIVFGVDSDRFYKETKTKTDKPFRMINFGININDGESVYLSLNGMPRDKVYFGGKENKDDEKNTTIPVDWAERSTFKKKGFNIYGTRVGLEKIVNDEGKEVNDVKTMHEFDACDYIKDNLKDGMSVFVKGNIEYSRYEGELQKKFVITQLSLTSKPIDFEDEDFEPLFEFKQDAVFSGIEKDEDKTKEMGKTVAKIDGYVVNYSSIEPIEFYLTNETHITVARKQLKKGYFMSNIGGDLVVTKHQEEVEEENVWGEGDGEMKSFDRQNARVSRDLFVKQINKLDAENYTQELIDDAISKINASKKAESEFIKENNEWGDGEGANLSIADDNDPSFEDEFDDEF